MILSLLPELSLILFISWIALQMLRAPKSTSCCSPLHCLLAMAVVAASVYGLKSNAILFSETYLVDGLSQIFKLFIAVGFLVAFHIAKIKPASHEKYKLEFAFFLGCATLGMMMITSSVNLITLYVALELSSYSLYILSGLRKDSAAAEGSMKYLLFGAVTSGFLLWGFSLILGLSGGASFQTIASMLPTLSAMPMFWVALTFIFFSFFFKLSAFPMHFWAPDTYQSSSTAVASLIATASKAAAISILIRFFFMAGLPAGLLPMLAVFAFISMTLGNAVALVQKDVKRLLAYSSIAQAGYVLLGLLSGLPTGYSAAIFYAGAYVLMNAAAFLVIAQVSKELPHDNPQSSDFNGLADRSPFLALLLLLSLLSLAGIPPLVGFTGKWILFTPAMQQGQWFLVLWAVLNSVVSLFYYLTVVKHAYLEKSMSSKSLYLTKDSFVLGLGLALLIVLLGIFPNELILLAQNAIGIPA